MKMLTCLLCHGANATHPPINGGYRYNLHWSEELGDSFHLSCLDTEAVENRRQFDLDLTPLQRIIEQRK